MSLEEEIANAQKILDVMNDTVTNQHARLHEMLDDNMGDAMVLTHNMASQAIVRAMQNSMGATVPPNPLAASGVTP